MWLHDPYQNHAVMVIAYGHSSQTVAQSSHLVGNFNAHLRDKLLVFADEAFWAGNKRAEGALKALVIESTMPIEMDSSYFKALRDEMEQGGRQALMQFLIDRDVSGVELRRIPRTDALAEQQLRSLDSVGQWLYAVLEAGGFEEQGAGGIAEFRSWQNELAITEDHARYLFYCKRHSIPMVTLSFVINLNTPKIGCYFITKKLCHRGA